jgi:cytochrome c biogenesis protein CcdA
MNAFYRFLLVFMGIILLFLGLIFLMGSSGETMNIAIGIVMIVLGCLFFLIIYRVDYAKAVQPKLMSQTVKVDLPGEKDLKSLKCKNCGSKLSENDLGMISGGVIVKCGYCDSVYELEEKPKW